MNKSGPILLLTLVLAAVTHAGCPAQWSGWSVIPGGAVTSRAPAIVNANNRVFAFIVDNGRIISNQMSLPSGNWSGWEAVPDLMLLAPGRRIFKTDQAVAGTVFASSLYLFAKGSDDNRIYFNVMPLQDGKWGRWRQVPPGNGTSDRPLTATSGGGVLYLFQKGMDQHIYFNALLGNTGNWRGWYEVPGNGTTDAPLAASATAIQLYLFHKGLNQIIYQNRLDLNTFQWSGFQVVPGGSRADLGFGSAILGDSLYLVNHGISDGKQYINRMSLSDQSWSGWAVVGGGTTNDVTAAAGLGTRLVILSKGVNVPQIYVNVLSPDIDCDGMSDDLETQMLARFRPYYKFTLDPTPDKYHPADALWFVRNSFLLDSPSQGSSVIISRNVLAANPDKVLNVYTNSWGWSDRRNGPNSVTQYRLDIDDNLRTGEPDWTKIRNSAVGLYGHVVPLHERITAPNLITGYKIEYWQFYAFNDAPLDDYRHEGDWETVQLVVETDGSTIRKIIHEVHGQPIVFEMIHLRRRIDIGEGILEYQGPEYGTVFWGPSGTSRAQNNLVRIYCFQGSCTHPVVYIEHSGHATWPSARWGWVGARKHEGDGDQYLVAVPPNLGEINAANPECPGAEIIINFNGHWGAKNDGPEGPTMKESWGKP